MNETSDHERSEYRIVYPLIARPRLTSAAGSYEVADVSEHGARLLSKNAKLPCGTRVSGVLKLAQGRKIDLDGAVVRDFADGFAVTFDDKSRIPLRWIIAEQQFLRERYPDWR